MHNNNYKNPFLKKKNKKSIQIECVMTFMTYTIFMNWTKEFRWIFVWNWWIWGRLTGFWGFDLTMKLHFCSDYGLIFAFTDSWFFGLFVMWIILVKWWKFMKSESCYRDIFLTFQGYYFLFSPTLICCFFLRGDFQEEWMHYKRSCKKKDCGFL